MPIEYARMQVVRKPWGRTDLRPWSEVHDGVPIGELWFQRADANAPGSALLLKLLFTEEPLSIQVHPDDSFAQSIGLTRGKTEAWYVVSAMPSAEVAIGLKRQLTAAQLRGSIDDGSISDLVQWRRVQKDDIIFVPAGTIHAIGAGLVIAEIQQRSDATFRLFDHGRQRELHVNNAVAVANAGPAQSQFRPKRLTDARTLLIACPHFVLERIDLSRQSNWELYADHETWLFILEGHARVGLMNAFVGEALFLEDARTSIEVGSDGLMGLLAYVGPEPVANLLRNLAGQNVGSILRASSRPNPIHHRARLGSPVHSTEARS